MARAPAGDTQLLIDDDCFEGGGLLEQILPLSTIWIDTVEFIQSIISVNQFHCCTTLTFSIAACGIGRAAAFA
jgi:hypothetical protein